MSTPVEGFFGMKLTLLVSGTVGGIVSLSYIKNLTPKKAFLAVITGAASATFIAPMIGSYFQFVEHNEMGFGFLIGLLGMNVLAGIFSVSERFGNKPIETLRELKNLKGE